MSMTRSIVSHSLSGFYIRSSGDRSQTLPFKYRISYQSCQYLSNRNTAKTMRTSERDFAVYASTVPGAPLPPGSPSGSWKTWILGMLMTVVLPLLTHKWGSLLKWKDDVEMGVETVERIVEVVEKVSEVVEKVAEDIVDELPESSSRLRNAVNLIDNLAKETAKDAHLADQFIDKVQEVEEQVESMVESAVDEAKEFTEEADQK